MGWGRWEQGRWERVRRERQREAGRNYDSLEMYCCDHDRAILTDERQRAWDGVNRKAGRAQHPGGERCRWRHQRVRREECLMGEDQWASHRTGDRMGEHR